MRLFIVRAALAGSLLAPQVAALPAEAGKQFFHKLWATACDNTLACEAVALPGEAATDRPLSLVVSRGSDAVGNAVVKIAVAEPKGDRYRIIVDGRLVDSGMLAKSDYQIQVGGPDALKLVRAIGRGRKLSVQASDGSELGAVSLEGSAAALTHIDAIQNRAGTRSALFAVGKKSLRVKSAPMPSISARRIGMPDLIPDAASIVSLVESSQCADDRFSVTEDTAYSLGKQQGTYNALALISCGTGAYNMSLAAYVGTSTDGKRWNFAPARFDYPSNGGNGERTLLVNASWDAASQQLSSYAKGRGLGDCGNAENYVWDGSMFRLVAAYGMSECLGSTEWMTLWRAKVEFKD